MIEVQVYHLSDKVFNEQCKTEQNKINLDEIIPLDSKYKEKIDDVKNKYVSSTVVNNTYTIIANTGFFTGIKDFVYAQLPLLLLFIISESQISVKKIIINNPPDRVYQAFVDHPNQFLIQNILRKSYELDKNLIMKIKKDLNDRIVGQKSVKKRILVNLVKYLYSNDTSPLVLAFIGPQGVGKTEVAKVLSDSLFKKGNLFREQMSMLTNGASQDYLFGSDPSSKSFSKSLLQRKSDVLLLDEFNLVNPNFYGAFYQLFDEGNFIDGYYTVSLKKAIIICTANFMSKKEMLEYLGAPLYSRFTDICVFDSLSVQDYLKISKLKLDEKLKKIKPEYSAEIDREAILNKIRNIEMFSDARNLDHILDQLIALEISKKEGII